MSHHRCQCPRYALMTALTASILLSTAGTAAAALPGGFDGTIPSTRSMAMGGAFSPLADDITAILANPAGLVCSAGAVLYADYMERGGGEGPREAKLICGLERWGVVFAAAGSKKEYGDGTDEGQLLGGLAVNLLSGSAGSFLSVGGALRAGRISFDLEPDCLPCGTAGGRYSNNALTVDLGAMIRLLPFISVSVSSENVSGSGFGAGDYEIPWDRTVRYGAAWLHEDRFSISWERRHSGGDRSDHFGFSLRTALPLEIMAGMSSDAVSGGARWDGEWWRASIVFGQDGENSITTGVSMEVFFNRPARIYQ